MARMMQGCENTDNLIFFQFLHVATKTFDDLLKR